jgi:erythromycin esterase
MRTRQKALGTSSLVLLAIILGGCGSSDASAPPPPTGGQPPLELPSLPARQLAWLEGAVVPLSDDDPAQGFDDLAPLREMIGNARVVALGEATHGTREFFRMKDRILRFLVQEMGFTAFAIEATWPESNRIDRYVRTGVGEPDTLLSGLYFWTWNTTEVLDMIRWMRDRNAGGGSVGFYGFDMQYPGMAIFNVREFVHAVDPASLGEVNSHMTCLANFANGPDGQGSSALYGQQPAASRSACHEHLESVYEWLVDHKAAYEAASSADEFALALRSARLAIQFEEAMSGRRSRDAAMAENVRWLLDRLGPNGKLVLWAHNFHVSTLPNAMGRDLRAALGSDLVILGFAFGEGSFSGVRMDGNAPRGLTTLTAPPVVASSYEHYFQSVSPLRFLLDLRRPLASDSASWLAGPRPLRSIGCCFDPDQPHLFAYQSRLPDEFDLMIYFQDTSPSNLLPYRPPSTF